MPKMGGWRRQFADLLLFGQRLLWKSPIEAHLILTPSFKSMNNHKLFHEELMRPRRPTKHPCVCVGRQSLVNQCTLGLIWLKQPMRFVHMVVLSRVSEWADVSKQCKWVNECPNASFQMCSSHGAMVQLTNGYLQRDTWALWQEQGPICTHV